RGLLRQPRADELVDRYLRFRAAAAERHGCGEPRLDDYVPVFTADLRVLPGVGTAECPPIRRMVADADLCIRGYACFGDRPCVPRRSDAGGFCVQRRAVRTCIIRVPSPSARRPRS